jgi:lysyl-tRNA synthetase, class II
MTDESVTRSDDDGQPHEGSVRESEILAARRESMKRLEAAGMPPFALGLRSALDVDEPDAIAQIRAEFGALDPGETTDEVRTVAGRIVQKRDMGKLKFIVVRDRAADIQLFCTAKDMDPSDLALLDEAEPGDIVGATGRVGTTKKGELSIVVRRWAMLSKALRPLPEKWHGLKDPDLQQRRRYLHLATDPLPRRYALARAAVLKAIRAHLDERGFIEFEGPMLQTVAGGALARSFTTFHHALDQEMNLRISLELYLKRMLVGGLERVYELGRNFRNEGIDRDHNPEFTMLEAYQAFGDYETMMRITEDLIVTCARAVAPIMGRDPGSSRISFRGREVDLTPPFQRITLLGSVSAAVGEAVTLDRADLRELATAHGVALEDAWGPGKVAVEMFDKLVEHTIERPTFVCDFPRGVSPLARPHRDDPSLTEHFDLVVGGLELVTAYSELADPIEQRAAFLEQVRERDRGDAEAHPLDEDFLRALEHGMPPAGGLGLGIDRLLMVLTDAPSLRDLIMFPSQRSPAQE